MKTAFFWIIVQRVVVIPYRRFETIGPIFGGQETKKKNYKLGLIGCAETSVRKCLYLRNNTEQCCFQIDFVSYF